MATFADVTPKGMVLPVLANEIADATSWRSKEKASRGDLCATQRTFFMGLLCITRRPRRAAAQRGTDQKKARFSRHPSKPVAVYLHASRQ
jgi:hypothetical protein